VTGSIAGLNKASIDDALDRHARRSFFRPREPTRKAGKHSARAGTSPGYGIFLSQHMLPPGS
jgi:hypothetical protein